MYLMDGTKRSRAATGSSPKWISSKSELHDTIARFDISDRDPRSTERKVTLAGTSGACRARFQLPPGTTRVGRRQAEIQLSASEISRLHATITVTGDQILLEDQNSSNGTFVNNARVQKVELRGGDVVIFGRTFRFVVAIEEPTRPPPPPPPAPPTPDEAAPHQTSAEETISALERERQDLATLFQISMRYLGARTPTECVDVLFEILPKVVRFDAAFAVTRRDGRFRLRPHPEGPRLKPAEYRTLADECKDGPVMLDASGDGLSLSSITVGSRVVIPLAGGGCFCLLSEQRNEYSGRFDFLAVLAQLHATAVAGVTPRGQ